MFSNARGDEVVVDVSDVSTRPSPWGRSICRASPFTRRVSIGVVRANTRLLACVSPKITFRTVQARERKPAGTRRGSYGCNCRPQRPGRVFFVRVCSASATDGHGGPLAGGVLANTSTECPFVCNRVVNVVGKPTWRPRLKTLAPGR